MSERSEVSKQMRVPMPTRPTFADAEVAFSAAPAVGRRFHLDIDEYALARIGKMGLEAAVAKLGEGVAHRHGLEIERVVHSYLLDREWAAPIIREAIRESVDRVIRDMMQNSPFGDALKAGEGAP